MALNQMKINAAIQAFLSEKEIREHKEPTGNLMGDDITAWREYCHYHLNPPLPHSMWEIPVGVDAFPFDRMTEEDAALMRALLTDVEETQIGESEEAPSTDLLAAAAEIAAEEKGRLESERQALEEKQAAEAQAAADEAAKAQAELEAQALAASEAAKEDAAKVAETPTEPQTTEEAESDASQE